MKYDTTPPATHIIALPPGATSITVAVASQVAEDGPEAFYAAQRIAQGASNAPETLRPSDTITESATVPHDKPRQVIEPEQLDPRKVADAGRPMGSVRWTGENAAYFANWLADPRAPRLITGMPTGWHVDRTHAHGATLTLQYGGVPIILMEGETLTIHPNGAAVVTPARRGAEPRAEPEKATTRGATYLHLVEDALQQLKAELKHIDTTKWTQAWHKLGERGQTEQQQRRNILQAELHGLQQVLDIAKAPPATDPNAEPGFITRMREELDQLSERYERLRHFMGSEQATTLDSDEREHMGAQVRGMHLYRSALKQRLFLAVNKLAKGAKA